jgi:acyl transferase domain-containing protein/acyl carrier protein
MNKYNGLEIAIIGISAQFPGCSDYNTFWQNLCAGKDVLNFFSDEELLKSGVSPGEIESGLYVRRQGVLDNKQHFDYGFFGYSPEEASLMDPQIRLFHTHCWMALEDAGCASLIDSKKIGLFAGASENSNWRLHVYSQNRDSSIGPFFRDRIANKDFITTLVSHKLNLRGPSIYLNTACSTSLVAVHMACRALLTKECNIALAGGVSINTTIKKGYHYQEGMIVSKDGYCRSFDADASGTSVGEGVGVVVLKLLSEAIIDKDNIIAVIKSSSVNNDGAGKVGYTAPSVKGQAECIKHAHKIAGVSPESISFVEAHGTATKLGDPIEVQALNIAFKSQLNNNKCALGSVKSNIGHLDSAAGIAGLIKTALALKFKKIPPTLNFKAPNPDIDFEGGPFYVNADLKDWNNANDLPLRAGVSSFGIGGTNAHLVLEESPALKISDEEEKYKLITASAKTQQSLRSFFSKLRTYIDSSDVNLSDFSYSLQAGRKDFIFRKSFAYSSKSELVEMLSRFESKSAGFTRSKPRSKSVVFMFSGAGSQYLNMGKGLYDNNEVFRNEMDKGFTELLKLTGEEYKNIFYPEGHTSSRINDMLYTQPAIFLFGYSLARLLISIGITPVYMIGHSIGEYVAACISGVLSYDDALKLVIARGKLMNNMPAGSMISVSINETEARKYLNSSVSVAAINGPSQVVLSGEVDKIERVISELDKNELSYVKLYASHAGHSPTIDSIITSYNEILKEVKFNAPVIPYVSNLTGRFITSEEATSIEYWSKHMRETVLFLTGIQTILKDQSEKIFIEIGGGHSLTTLLKQMGSPLNNTISLNMIRHPKEEEYDQKYFMNKLGYLWELGVNIDWKAYYKNNKRYKIPLPVYAFDEFSFPVEVDPYGNDQRHLNTDRSQMDNSDKSNWIYFPCWKSSVPKKSSDSNIRTCLFFSDNTDLFADIIKKLRESGHKIIQVTPDKTYGKQTEDCFSINSLDNKDYNRLFEDPAITEANITDLIYGWGLLPKELIMSEKHLSVNYLYFNLANAVSQLCKNNIKEYRISVLTRSLHNVIGNEKINVDQSVLLGLVNVMAQEYNVICTNIDLPEETENRLTELVSHEILSVNTSESIVALRNGNRWVRSFQQVSPELVNTKKRLKKNGIYLITGGLGKVGMVIAEYLLVNYDAIVVIYGRGPIDSKVKGSSEEKLNLLKSKGQVTYYQGNVSDHDALEKCRDEINNTFGKINGVIHTAGNVDWNDFELIDDLTPAKAFRMFSPKITGVNNLYNIFKENDLDFVWITSSIASVLGGLSYASYASANIYMDHFVQSKPELGNWKSINLGEMIFTDEEIEREKKNYGRTALKPTELCELFEYTTELEGPRVIVETSVNLFDRINKTYISKQNYLAEEFNAANVEKLERSGLSTVYKEPITKTEKTLVKILEDFFGISEIGIEDNFFEMGGDSLKAMVISKRIKKDLGVNLIIKEFFRNPTIKEIAVIIDEIYLLTSNKNHKSKTIV